MSISFPDEVINGADDAMEIAGNTSVLQLAEQADIEQQANTFKLHVAYDVQPTDDGKKIFAKFSDDGGASGFTSAVIQAYLARMPLRQARQEHATQAAISQQQQDAASQDQKQAALDEAEATRKLAIQSLNSVWEMLPAERRRSMFPIQRAWVRKKAAGCRLEAAQFSTDPTERETTRLQCEARMDNGRAEELRPLLDEMR